MKKINKRQLRRLVLEAMTGVDDWVDHDPGYDTGDSGSYVPGKYEKYFKGGPNKGELNPAFGRDIQSQSVNAATSELYQEALDNSERIKGMVIELSRMYKKHGPSPTADNRLYPTIQDDHYHKVNKLLNDLDINTDEFMITVGAVIERYYH